MAGIPNISQFLDQGEPNETVRETHAVDVNSDDSLSQKSRKWALFGEDFPREEIVFLCQFVILSIVIVFSLINLSVGNGNESIWTFLIGTALGALVPCPQMQNKVKKLKNL